MSVSTIPSPFRRAQEVLCDLHASCSWADLEKFVLERVHPLIGAARGSWTEFRTGGRIGYNEWSVDHRSLKARYTPIMNQFLGKQHPGLTALNPHQPWDRVWRITDFFSQREFERTELCNEGYRPTESRFQMTLQVYCSPFSHTTATFGRNHRDFTDNERDTLDYLLPHFRLVADRLVRDQRVRETYRWRSANCWDSQPWLSFDHSFYLRDANAHGLALLKACPHFDGLRLPPVIIKILAEHDSLHRRVDSHIMIGRSCFRLCGSSSTNPIFRFVAFEEETPEKYLLQRGTRVTLTRREREIAMWVREGKSNRDIGIILGISPRTVGKHLENIFEKLQIESRTAFMVRNP